MIDEYIKYQDLNVGYNLDNTFNINGINGLGNNNLSRKFVYHDKKLDLFEDGIDLNEQFVNSPDKTFLIRVKGDSMIGAGIDDGDIILVDSSIKPKHNNIVVASINNKLVVKRLHYSYKETMLISENDDYLPIRPKEKDKLKFLGVAIMVIKDMKN